MLNLRVFLLILCVAWTSSLSATSFLDHRELVVEDVGLVYGQEKVGIGYSNPLQELDVSGNVRYTGQLSTEAISRITPLYLRGTGFNNSIPREVRLGQDVLVSNSSRGLYYIVISKTSHAVVSSANYDTHGSAVASDSLAAALATLGDNQIGMLVSFDAWEGALSANLKNSFRTLGLTKGLMSVITGVRRPYAAIFESSAGRVWEVVQPNTATAPYAEIRGFLIDEGIVASSEVDNAIFSPSNGLSPVLVDDAGRVGIYSESLSDALTLPESVFIRKPSGAGAIFFDAASNDPGFIYHSDVANVGRLWIAVSDDWDVSNTLDEIIFGDSNLVTRRFRFEGNGQAFAAGWVAGGADYAEWFIHDEVSQPGDLVGLNLETGNARKYQAGDYFLGIHSTEPGFVGNYKGGEYSADLTPTHTLVGLIGQLPFDQSQVTIQGRVAYTLDGHRIGPILSNNKVLLR